MWHLIHVIHWLKISNSYLYVVQSHRYSQNSQSRCKGFSKEWFLWIMLLWINGTVQLHILTKYGFHSHANFTTRIPETFYFLLHYSENLYDSVYIYIYFFLSEQENSLVYSYRNNCCLVLKVSVITYKHAIYLNTIVVVI